MKDKMVVMFEEELRRRLRRPPSINRITRELFESDNRIFLMNAKDRIVTNIEQILDRYFRSTG